MAILGFVYRIRNKINGAYYVGSTSGPTRRFVRHRYELRSNFHHCVRLQRAWNKYGEDAFEFELLHKRDRQSVVDIEQNIINRYYGSVALYNTSSSALASCDGKMSTFESRIKRKYIKRARMSEASKLLISEKARNRKISPKHIVKHAKKRMVRLSVHQAFILGKMHADGMSWESISRSYKIGVKIMRREIKRHFDMSCFGAPVAPKRNWTYDIRVKKQKEKRWTFKRPDLAEKNKNRVWTEEARKKLSNAQRLINEQKREIYNRRNTIKDDSAGISSL
jgi:group I intron endonuclease